MTTYGELEFGQHCFRSRLVACWHKAITRTNIDYHQSSPVVLQMLKIAIIKICCKITHLKLPPYPLAYKSQKYLLRSLPILYRMIQELLYIWSAVVLYWSNLHVSLWNISMTNHLISTMRIPIVVRQSSYIESGPRYEHPINHLKSDSGPHFLKLFLQSHQRRVSHSFSFDS